ncbi:MAG: CPBP family intramembrane metalloprotease [Bacillota bacterium]|nr:CPBP family intramembrane metalloprotease [Bacillota bacterium]
MSAMKGKSIIEVTSFFALLAAFGRWRYAVTQSVWSPLTQSFALGLLMILAPVLLILITRRSFEVYGFTLKGWQANLDVGLKGYLARFLPWGLGYAIVVKLGGSYTDPTGAVVLSAAYMLATAVLLRVLRKASTKNKPVSDLLLVSGLLLCPILVGLALRRLTVAVITTVVWQFIFSGFGEEMIYRGYIQSRVNEEFGRPWELIGVRFGPGLIVAALAFGLSHVANTYNPWVGQYSLSWYWGLWTFFAGLFFGFIREKTGSLLAAGLAHGLPDAVGEGFAVLLGWRI